MSIYEIQFHQVTCISKLNRESRFESIKAIGGNNWKYSVEKVIELLATERHMFYVISKDGVSLVKKVERDGKFYLRTVWNREESDNLLSLPECP